MTNRFCPYINPLHLADSKSSYWGCSVRCDGKCLKGLSEDYAECEDFPEEREKESRLGSL